MANLRVDLDHPPIEGETVTFRTPCDCDSVSELNVWWQTETGSMGHGFCFKDSHGNDLTSLGNLFKSGVLVSVLLDTTNYSAYILNADTNAYLEDKIQSGNSAIFSSSVSVDTTTNAVTITNQSVYCREVNGLIYVYGDIDLTINESCEGFMVLLLDMYNLKTQCTTNVITTLNSIFGVGCLWRSSASWELCDLQYQIRPHEQTSFTAGSYSISLNFWYPKA